MQISTTNIIARGVPVKYPELGDIRIYVSGTDKEIYDVDFRKKVGTELVDAPEIEKLFRQDLSEGPSYPLCAEPYSMRCALFILYEWFGEAESCWVEEPKHVTFSGEIEPMPSEPGVVY